MKEWSTSPSRYLAHRKSQAPWLLRSSPTRRPPSPLLKTAIPLPLDGRCRFIFSFSAVCYTLPVASPNSLAFSIIIITITTTTTTSVISTSILAIVRIHLNAALTWMTSSFDFFFSSETRSRQHRFWCPSPTLGSVLPHCGMWTKLMRTCGGIM